MTSVRVSAVVAAEVLALVDQGKFLMSRNGKRWDERDPRHAGTEAFLDALAEVVAGRPIGDTPDSLAQPLAEGFDPARCVGAYTVAEVAALWGTTTSGVRWLCATDGRVRAHAGKVGRAWVLDPVFVQGEAERRGAHAAG